MVPRPFRVSAVTRETDDTVTVDLFPAGDGDPAAFRPGQFTMVAVPGVGEVPLSIAGDLDRPGVLQHTVRAVGAVTNRLAALAPGDAVGVRGPFGRPWPLERARGRDLIVVAGGIGMAPLRTVVQHALQHRGRFDDVALLYGARTPLDLLYRTELHEWRSRFDIEVEITVDRGGPDWHGDVGVVTALFDLVRVEPGAIALVCGPEIMMRVVAEELLERGLVAGDIAVSLERNMECGIGWCGHCQLGPVVTCVEGPVVAWSRVAGLLRTPEV
jgi:NAD(P)H-flavin reductase